MSGTSVLPARRVAPAGDVLSPSEYARIQAARSRAAARVAALRDDLGELESLLGGAAPAQKVAQGRPRIMYMRSLLSQTLQVPAASADMGVEGILENFGEYGLRDRSFDKVVPVTAPQPINNTGSSYDAGDVFDAWILNPNIDTKFDFVKPPNQNTPFISANSRMRFEVRAQKIYYLAQNANTTGTLQIWLFKFAT